MTLRIVKGPTLAARGHVRSTGSRQWLSEPSDDPAARQRELQVVLELCAARERGARLFGAPNGCQSAAAVPKSYPGPAIRGIGEPITRSIDRTIAISSGAMNVNASPVAAARPVRPMRCT